MNWEGTLFTLIFTEQIIQKVLQSSLTLDVYIERFEADKNRRYLLLEASIFESTFLFCNIYSPNDNDGQNTFFSKLSDSLGSTPIYKLLQEVISIAL